MSGRVPGSQNLWQLASPLSSVVVGSVGGVAVGVEMVGGGSCSADCISLPGTNACKNTGFAFDSTGGESNATQVPPLICYIIMPDMIMIWTRLPTLHESACPTVILAPQPSQAAGISRRGMVVHLEADVISPFVRMDSHDSSKFPS
jgi:hypothetical protein